MQRFTTALVALLSLMALSVRPSLAQQGQAAEPTPTPQEVTGQATQNVAPIPPVVSATPAPPAVMVAPVQAGSDGQEREDEVFLGVPLLVEENETYENITIKDAALEVKGQVKGDVLAIHSDVILHKGAKIGGTVVVVGGKVTNEAGKEIRIVRQAGSLWNDGLIPALPMAPPAVMEQVVQPHHVHPAMAGGPLTLTVLGLLGGLVLLLFAPRATQQVTSLVSLEPARCLVVGLIASAILGAFSIFNARLMLSGLGGLWLPVGAVVALMALVIVGIGWLCGMRYVGDLVAHKVLHHTHAGRFYSRMALGLLTFFLGGLLLSCLHLEGVVLFAQSLVAVMGLGAIFITGGGSDPDWLGTRLRGEARWFSRRRW